MTKMILYHYRSIESALLEIGNGTFHFAASDELNDPIEGYVKIFWKGDRFAWEGLFRNYICSLNQAIDLFLLRADGDMLHHKSLIIDIQRYDDVPLGEILKTLGDSFLKNAEVQKLAAFYGDKGLKVNEEELCLILRFIHTKALILCIRKSLESGLISEEMADGLLKLFSTDSSFPAELMETELVDEVQRTRIAKEAEAAFEDLIGFHYVKIGLANENFLYGKRVDGENTDTETQWHRNWMAIAVDFPKMYVEQLKNMIYPESYVACFSGKCNDSAMWGNYAQNHQGVCLIYETDSNNVLLNELKSKQSVSPKIKAVSYEGEQIERNFFETLGILPPKQIAFWLTGTEGISSIYDVYSTENEWRDQYWDVYDIKTYRKLKAWEHENEYRIVLPNTFYDFSKPESRNLKYDPKILRGVIFGINTSEYDKKQIMEKLRNHAEELTDFKFYQAEYNDETQDIRVREKRFWKLNGKIK